MARRATSKKGSRRIPNSVLIDRHLVALGKLRRRWDKQVLDYPLSGDAAATFQAMKIGDMMEVMMEKLEKARKEALAYTAIEWAKQATAGKGSPLKARKGITKVDLAETCGVSRTYISLFLSGKIPSRRNPLPPKTEARIVNGIIKAYLRHEPPRDGGK